MTWKQRIQEFQEGLALPTKKAADRLSLWLEGFRMDLPPDEPVHLLVLRLAVATQKTTVLSEILQIVKANQNWPVLDSEHAKENLKQLERELGILAGASSTRAEME